MTAEEFARLLKGRRVGRGKWQAACPVHEVGGRHRPSLSIAEGRKSPVVFKCMSQGCDQKAILDAMGLTWQDVLGEREMTTELRRRYSDSVTLEKLEENRALFALLAGIDRRKRKYWLACDRNARLRIGELRRKIDPEGTKKRVRIARIHRFIAKRGWDAAWDRYLASHDTVIDGIEQSERARYTFSLP